MLLPEGLHRSPDFGEHFAVPVVRQRDTKVRHLQDESAKRMRLFLAFADKSDPPRPGDANDIGVHTYLRYCDLASTRIRALQFLAASHSGSRDAHGVVHVTGTERGTAFFTATLTICYCSLTLLALLLILTYCYTRCLMPRNMATLAATSIATLARMTISLCSSAPVSKQNVTRMLSGTRKRAPN